MLTAGRTRREQIADDLARHGCTRFEAALLASDLEATPVCKRWTLWGVVYGRTGMAASNVRGWLETHGFGAGASRAA